MLDKLERATEMFRRENAAREDPVCVLEMSLRNLRSDGAIDPSDFLARADTVAALGKTVMISNLPHYYALADCLRRYTSEPIAFALGVPGLAHLFEEQFYADLDGGILEAFGRLFKRGVRLYVYPYREHADGRLVTGEELSVPPPIRHLHAYLVEHHRIKAIQEGDTARPHLFPQDVLAMLQAGGSEWEALVPDAAARVIKECGYFGCRPARTRSPGT
jgi:hypothetical protein